LGENGIKELLSRDWNYNFDEDEKKRMLDEAESALWMFGESAPICIGDDALRKIKEVLSKDITFVPPDFF